MADFPESSESSFEGDIEKPKTVIEDPGNDDQQYISTKKTDSTLIAIKPNDSSASEIGSIIAATFPQFHSTERKQKFLQSLKGDSENHNRDILNAIRASWESSDMKYRFDHSVGNLSIRYLCVSDCYTVRLLK